MWCKFHVDRTTEKRVLNVPGTLQPYTIIMLCYVLTKPRLKLFKKLAWFWVIETEIEGTVVWKSLRNDLLTVPQQA